MNKTTLVLLSIVLCIILTFSIFFMLAVGKKSLQAKQESAINTIDENKFYIFVILDDAGMRIDELYAMSQFKGKYTIAVIPRLPESKVIANYLFKNNIPYIIHLPMQAKNTVIGKNFLHENMTDAQVYEYLNYNFSEFDNYIGFNNHMGSKATTNTRLVELMMKFIAGKSMIVLDSRTTPDSILFQSAKAWGNKAIEKTLFIDNLNDFDYISKKIQEGVKIAKERGFVVLIGHITKEETSRALIHEYDKIEAQGGVFLGLDDLHVIGY